MTVTIGAITLSDHLTLDGIDIAPVRITQRRTIAGRPITQSAPAPGGRTLVLAGEHHWTYDQAAALRALAALAAPVLLIHHRGAFNVLIQAIELEPSITYANPSGSDWLSGSVTLLEV